jgi:hypothetical protein
MNRDRQVIAAASAIPLLLIVMALVAWKYFSPPKQDTMNLSTVVTTIDTRSLLRTTSRCASSASINGGVWEERGSVCHSNPADRMPVEAKPSDCVAHQDGFCDWMESKP